MHVFIYNTHKNAGKIKGIEFEQRKMSSLSKELRSSLNLQHRSLSY